MLELGPMENRRHGSCEQSLSDGSWSREGCSEERALSTGWSVWVIAGQLKAKATGTGRLIVQCDLKRDWRE